MSVGNLNPEGRGDAARANTGKPAWHKIPLFALEGLVKVQMYGDEKYAPGNYLKGQPWSLPFDSLIRHLAKWQRGEDIDPESGLPHLDHAMCNLMYLSVYRTVYPEGDDRIARMRTEETRDEQSIV